MVKPNLPALGAGALSGLLAVSLAAGAPGGLVFAYLLPLPLYLAGLGLGAAAAGQAAVAGTVFAAVFGGPEAGLNYAVAWAAPIWVAMRVLLAQRPAGSGGGWVPAGHALSLLVALAAVGLVGFAVFGWVSGAPLSSTMYAIFDAWLAHFAPNLAGSEREILAGAVVPYLPSAIAFAWLTLNAINGLIAQMIVVRLGRQQRPWGRLADFVVPEWADWFTIGAAGLALLGPGELGYMGFNAALVLFVPYAVLGLATVHALARRIAFPGTALVVFYVLALLTMPWIAGIMALLGFAEQWFGIRRRLPPRLPPPWGA